MKLFIRNFRGDIDTQVATLNVNMTFGGQGVFLCDVNCVAKRNMTLHSAAEAATLLNP